VQARSAIRSLPARQPIPRDLGSPDAPLPRRAKSNTHRFPVRRGAGLVSAIYWGVLDGFDRALSLGVCPSTSLQLYARHAVLQCVFEIFKRRGRRLTRL
jgi:hypothetical protein